MGAWDVEDPNQIRQVRKNGATVLPTSSQWLSLSLCHPSSRSPIKSNQLYDFKATILERKFLVSIIFVLQNCRKNDQIFTKHVCEKMALRYDKYIVVIMLILKKHFSYS